MEILAMNGYGFYVWGSYGVTALVIAIEILSLRIRFRRARVRAATPERIHGSAAEARR